MTNETELRERAGWLANWRRLDQLEAEIGSVRREILRHCPDSPKITAHTVKFVVAGATDITIEEMDSPIRPEYIAWPRQIAMYLCRELLHMRLERIGQSFGGRDHGTVIHAIRRVKQRMETEPKIQSEIEALKAQITKV